MAPYKKCRNRVWLKTAMKSAGVSSIKTFEDWFYSKGLKGYGLKQWYDYRTGEVSPSDDLVDLIDCQLEGTMEVFKIGPGGLPLWVALGKDVNSQNEVLDDFLIGHREIFHDYEKINIKNLRSLKIQEKAFLIFNLIIPSKYKVKEQHDKFDDGNNFEESLVWEYKFNEYLTLKNNVLGDYYNEGKSVRYASIVKNKKTRLFHEYKLSNPVILVALMILTKLLDGEMKKYFKFGIKDAVQDIFKEDVLECFLEINQ